MIEVRLFGSLRRYATDSAWAPVAVMCLPVSGSKTLGQVLDQVGIDPTELGNIFLNGRMLPRSMYAVTLGYQMTSETPLSLEGCLRTLVQAGDRLGIFPKNMSSVVV
jgi:hypothetical protein